MIREMRGEIEHIVDSMKKVTILLDEGDYLALRKKLMDEGTNFTSWVRENMEKELLNTIVNRMADGAMMAIRNTPPPKIKKKKKTFKLCQKHNVYKLSCGCE